ncbi:hypothetical protein ACTXG5_21900 [Mycobacterium sp. Dal123C01]|uniref:hypothetical protein n=1 Tax=Mycobacterium sp. Dal123C01 TaxID=3457577 RepID=UPI00403EBB48
MNAAAKTAPSTAAKKAPAKQAVPAKATAKAKVLPKPVAMQWEAKDMRGTGYQVANGARHTYRVAESEGAWWCGQKLTNGGSWVHVADRCATEGQAKELAGYVEGGATWLSHQAMRDVPFETVIEQYSS